MNNRMKGSIQVALAAACWSFAGVFSKWIPWSSITLNGLRSLFGAVILCMLRRNVRIKLTKGTFLGALGVSLTSLLYMFAVKLTSAANAIVLQYAMPVFVIAFCWLFYGQRPSKRHLFTAGFILLGVMLCSWEGMTGGHPVGDLLAIVSAVTFALVFFCSRMPGANAQDYSFLGLILGATMSVYAFFDPAMTLEPLHWLGIAAMGLCLAAGYYLVSLGMANTSPITSALLSNLEPILNPIWVFIFLGEQPGVLTLIGAGVVLITATLYAILGNRGKSEV